MATTSYQIADKLFLNVQPIVRKQAARVVVEQTNHVLVFDCSGSMYGVLPAIRNQIKNKLPTLAKPGDTATIIWFSGRGDCDILIKGHRLDNASDFSTLNKAVDQWLRPMGLTGFKEPLEKVIGVVGDLSKNGNPFSLFFFTDGADNQWREPEILAVCDRVGVVVQSTTLVEFGYYCNRPLLTKMAERMGGSLIFSESFLDYEPTFEAAVQRRPLGGKKISVQIEGSDMVGDFVWSYDGNPTVYRPTAGEVTVSEGIDQVCYLSTKSVGKPMPFTKTCPAQMDAYVALALYAQRMNADVVLGLLKATGDVRLIDQFASCFTKQSYSVFQQDVLAAAADPSLRLTAGYDPSRVPPEDAYTILDILATLAMDDGNKFYPKHPSFGYQRIGRATEQTDSRLNDEEQAEITAMTAGAKSKADFAKVKARLDEILAAKPQALKFTTTDENPGVSVSSLTTNESRPNVSVLLRMEGTVDLRPLATDEKVAALFAQKGVPLDFPTQIFRNYTIIADGVVNSKVLPVSLTASAYNVFRNEGLIPASTPYVEGSIYLLDISHVPTVNRKMIRATTARRLFEIEFEAERIKAGNKVINDELKRLGGPDNSADIESKYGKEVADLLKLNGITDKSFSPLVVQKPAVDTYLGKELKSSIKGLSSLPKISDVRTAMTKKKFVDLTVSNKLVAEWLPVIDQLSTAITDPEQRRAKLEEELKKNRQRSRELDRKRNEIKFAVTAGQVWFADFKSLDENTLTLKVPQIGDLDCKVELIEKEYTR